MKRRSFIQALLAGVPAVAAAATAKRPEPRAQTPIAFMVSGEHAALLGVCACGRPATHAVRDSIMVERNGFEFHEPIGLIRGGCDQHRVTARLW